MEPGDVLCFSWGGAVLLEECSGSAPMVALYDNLLCKGQSCPAVTLLVMEPKVVVVVLPTD